MADTKISALPAATTPLAGTELVPIVQGGETKVVPVSGISSGGSGTVTSVAVSGGTTGLTTSGGPVTGSGTITLAGTLAVANGGTGAATQQAAINALAGATTSGQYLRGNGSNVSMSAIQAGDLPAIPLSGLSQSSATTGQVPTWNGSAWAPATPSGGGGGSPGGSNTQIQFNDSGAFGGDSGLAFDKTTGKMTVGGKTVTASAPVLDLSQSWNAGAVTFTGIKFNVTSDVSASGSLLMDLQVGGVSKFKVDKSGATTIAGNTTISGSLVSNGPNANFTDVGLGVSATYGFNTRSSGLNVVVGGYFSARFTTGSLGVKVLSINSFDPSTNGVSLTNDDVNILAQRNGVNAQTSRLYGTYTDASNYRRLTKTMSAAGVAEIKPEGSGTGATGNVLYISGLPTSNPGPGILWNNGGVVNVGT